MIVIPRVTKPLVVQQSPIPRQNLALWLRADRGVVLDTTSTPTVSQWLDQSGNGRHATQETKASQPTLISSSANSKPAVRFVTGFLTCPLVNISDKLEVFVVFKRIGSSTGNNPGLLSFGDPGIADYTSSSYIAVFYEPGNSVFTWCRAGNLAGTDSYLTGVDVLAHSAFDGNQNTLTYNSTVYPSVATSGNFNYSVATIGSRLEPGVFNVYNGEMCELLVYHKTLMATDRGRINNYLKTRYNV